MAKKHKVLIVEDNRPISKAMKIELELHGFEAYRVFDGQEALKMVNNKKFDLLLVDLIMPEMDGYTFIAEVKKLNLDIPIIVVSNINNEDGGSCEKKLGVD